MSEKLGRQLLELRETKLNCSRQELASMLSVEQSAYSDYEAGRTEPPLEMLLKLSKIFGVKPGVLISDEQIMRYLDQREPKIVPVRLTRNEELIMELLWDGDRALTAQELAASSDNRIPNPSHTKALAISLRDKGFVEKTRMRFHPKITRHDYQCLVQIAENYAHKLDDVDCLKLLVLFI